VCPGFAEPEEATETVSEAQHFWAEEELWGVSLTWPKKKLFRLRSWEGALTRQPFFAATHAIVFACAGTNADCLLLAVHPSQALQHRNHLVTISCLDPFVTYTLLLSVITPYRWS